MQRSVTKIHSWRPLTIPIIAFVIPWLVACSKAVPTWPPETRATLVGSLCGDGICRCRISDSQAGQPTAADHKRFEFKLGPAANELWVTVNGMTLYKDKESNNQCFYLDLAPGRHNVRLRARDRMGVAAGLAISEMHTNNYWWYKTFQFRCGTPGGCEKTQLARYRDSLNNYQRGIHDPCGSTKIHGLNWESGRLSSGRVLRYLDFRFALDIRGFVPKHPSNHPACRDRF